MYHSLDTVALKKHKVLQFYESLVYWYEVCYLVFVNLVKSTNWQRCVIYK